MATADARFQLEADLEPFFEKLRAHTDEVRTQWIDYASTRPAAAARVRWLAAAGMLDHDVRAIQAARQLLLRDDGPTALAVLVERVRIREAVEQGIEDAWTAWFGHRDAKVE